MKKNHQFEDWLKPWPKTRHKFLSWMIELYGTTPQYFFTAPRVEQYRAVARLLGYSYVFEDDYKTDEIFELVSKYLYLYEDILEKYPAGPEDLLLKLNEMSFEGHRDMFPEIHEPSKFYTPSLNAAIVKYSKDYKMDLNFKDVLPSLNKALVDIYRQDAIPEEETMEEFFERTIIESHKFRSGELVCPF